MKRLNKRTLAASAVVVLAIAGASAAGASKGKGKASQSKRGGTSALSKANRGDHGLRRGDDFDAAVAYLGLTAAQVQTDLTAGKTLAQIAAATTGKSTDGLIAALVTHEKAELAAKVAAGAITQAQADAVIPTLTAHFTAFVNGTGGPGFRGGHGPGGPGGPGGHSDELVRQHGAPRSARPHGRAISHGQACDLFLRRQPPGLLRMAAAPGPAGPLTSGRSEPRSDVRRWPGGIVTRRRLGRG